MPGRGARPAGAPAFPGKRGFAAIEGRNLTNTRFTYQREAVALDAFYPDRQVVFKLGWYF